jgi:hypothetical protein
LKKLKSRVAFKKVLKTSRFQKETFLEKPVLAVFINVEFNNSRNFEITGIF